MPYVIGVDEAGYGPNLGPLVVSATAWQTASGVKPDKLYDVLADFVAAPWDGAEEPDENHDGRLAIGDSKALYKAGGSLAGLERGVHAALALVDRLPRRWREIWSRLDPAADETIDACPWHANYDEPLPIEPPDGTKCPSLADLDAGLRRAGVRLADLRARVMFPCDYNDLVKQYDNKAEVLSLTTLTLVRQVLDGLDGPAVVLCDKHGGRGYYAALLQHFFPDELIKIQLETREAGVYVLRHAGRRIEFRFLAKGERMLPIALASMTAKYLRELAMRPFNAFWQRHVPGLRPTAGYPTDASRFRAEIRKVQRKLAISDRVLWRCR
jgi:hypothetical protein